MNIKATIAILLFTTLFFCPVKFLFAGEAGAATASFLKFTPSPRATGMGEAYTSITADAYAAYWNPAGLASLEIMEIAATYNQSFEDINHQYVSIAYPLRYGSVLDLNITRLSIADFQGYDAMSTKTKLVGASDLAIGVAYARTFIKDEIERPVFNVGINLKSVNSSLDSVSAMALAVDIGVLYHIRSNYYWMKNVPAQEWKLGFAAKNIGTKMKFDEVSFPLPMSFTLGASWQGHPGANSGLIFSLDQTFSNDDKYTASIGSEFTAFQLLALRLGFKSGQDEGSGIRAGFGFKLSFIDLDYSMSPFGDLGGMHKFGVSVKLGQAKSARPLDGKTSRIKKAKLIAKKDKIEKLDEYAEDFIALAEKKLNLKQYVLALKNINNAFNLKPSLRGGKWGAKCKRLSVIADKLRLKDIPERSRLLSLNKEQSNIAGEAIMSYMNGNTLKAFLLAHAAFGTNVEGDVVFEELLNALSDLTNRKIRRREILPKKALIKEKLRKAAAYFYARQFDMTAVECEEVVLLDDYNALAWTRLGSSYFVLGEKKKSREAYFKALEINPSDGVTREFIKIQGWE